MSIRSIALLGAMLLCPLIAQGAGRTLDTPLHFRSAGGQPVAGDFNRDGKQDVLLLTERNVRFVPGYGDGTFGKPVVTDAVNNGRVMGLADFNRDGNADLYTANAPFAVMPGRGDGTFADPVSSGGYAPLPTLITAGDFNGDTFVDLACASTSTVVVHFGDGAGAFTAGPSTPLSVEGTFSALKAADFDGDGRDDLFLLTDTESLIAWNGGTGTFPQQARRTANGKYAAAGDVNGDGLADIVTASGDDYSPAQGWTEVLFGAGTRNVATAARFPSLLTTAGLTLAQMDGIGGLDIVVGTRDVIVIAHDGTNFRAPRSFAATPSAGSVAAADFDGDGKTDVLSFHFDTPSAVCAFIHGNGDGTLRADPSFRDLIGGGNGTASNVPAVTDVNGDGIQDLVIVNAVLPTFGDNSASLAVAFGNGAGGFAAPIVTAWTPAFRIEKTPTAGDINGDGRVDLLFQGIDLTSNTARWQPFFLQQNGTFVAGPITSGTSAPVKLVADLTADGRLDVLDTAGKRYAGNPNGTFGSGVAIGIPLYAGIQAVDLNHDGRPDIATWGQTTGFAHYELRCYLANSDGTFSAPHTTDNISSVTAFADVNGDGFPELFAFNDTMYRANGDGTFSSQPFNLTTLDGYLPNKPWAADFDGDGRTDVAVPGVIFYGTGQAAFDGAARMATVAEIISTADFDGNGSPDVWMADPRAGRIVIVRTRRGTDGTVPPVMTVDLENSSHYGQGVRPRIGVAVDDPVEARGAVLVQVDSGVASLYLPDATGAAEAYLYVPIGTVTIRVTFTGDTYYGPVSVSMPHTVEKGIPDVRLFVNPTTLEKGGSINACAYVLPYSPASQPTGIVTIRKDGIVIGTATASDTCNQPLTLADLPVGVFTLTAEYPGDDVYAPRTATQTVKVTRLHTTLLLALPAGPVYEGQQASITASFPEDPGITGTVTFTRNGKTFPVPIANGKAVLTTTFTWGSGELSASYGGSTDFEPAYAASPFQVYRSGMNTPPVLLASTVPNGPYFDVTLTIPAVYGAHEYYIYRSVNAGPLSLWLWSGASPDRDAKVLDRVQPGLALAYTVVARDEAGNASPMGPRVVTSSVAFTDPALTNGQTGAKALHISELQAAINGYREAAGLPLATFTPVAPGVAISAAHLNQLRTALAEARTALGRPIAFTDPSIAPGVTPLRAVHLRELRDGIR